MYDDSKNWIEFENDITELPSSVPRSVARRLRRARADGETHRRDGLATQVEPAAQRRTTCDHGPMSARQREEQQRQGIFLCYRREDSRWQAGRLADALADRYGDKAVFMDVDRLRIGNWRKQIDQSLADCAAVIVVIGPQWLAELEQRSASDDQVRYEIAQALLLDKIIIPVAVDRAPLPHRGDLPEDIAALNDAQGYELGVDVMWRPTVGKLLDDLSDLLRDRSTTQYFSQTPAESRPENVVTVAEVKSARHEAEQRAPDAPIFISYMREDAEAARRLRDAITRLGAEAWLDERRLGAGDEWQKEILTAIGETVRLFVPVISANTEREREGYVFREWAEAVGRSPRISSGHFIVPVIIDEDYDGDLSRYPKGRKYFGRLQFGRAPAGEPDAELLAMLTAEIRAMRRTDAS